MTTNKKYWENIQKLKNVIESGKFNLFEIECFLEGLELLGNENFSFWLNAVSYASVNMDVIVLKQFISIISMMSKSELRTLIKSLQDNRAILENPYSTFFQVLNSISVTRKDNFQQMENVSLKK